MPSTKKSTKDRTRSLSAVAWLTNTDLFKVTSLQNTDTSYGSPGVYNPSEGEGKG